ncbi:uncharacterized protein LOC122365120 [Amphibalanus amphitrite]|uniref:uncharacterized protein LOC122365120 n=1 Tax=Amphibalanus amphitrite TaxID=1232801 RepID=UPI001C908822|nr:uncharacterized protein LOC122365120 [Amphibalanus amphitrite]
MIHARSSRGVTPRSLVNRKARPATFPTGPLLSPRLPPSSSTIFSSRPSTQTERKSKFTPLVRENRPVTPKIVIELADSERPTVPDSTSRRPMQVAPPSLKSLPQMSLRSGRSGIGFRGNGDDSSCIGKAKVDTDSHQTYQRAPMSTLSPTVIPRRRRSTSFAGRETMTPREAIGATQGHARRASQPLPTTTLLAPLHSFERRGSGPPSTTSTRLRRRGTPLFTGVDTGKGGAMSTQRRHSEIIANRPLMAPPLRALRRLSSEPDAMVPNIRHRDTYRRDSETQPRKRAAEVVVSDLRNGNVSAPTMRLLGLVQRVPTPGRVRCLLRRYDAPPVDVLSERSRRVTIQFHNEHPATPEVTRARSLSMPAMEYSERGGGIVCKTNDIMRLQQAFGKIDGTEERPSTSAATSDPGGSLDNQRSRLSTTDGSVVPWEGNDMMVNVWALGKALEDYLNVSERGASH